jgi:hypothetical protein
MNLGSKFALCYFCTATLALRLPGPAPLQLASHASELPDADDVLEELSAAGVKRIWLVDKDNAREPGTRRPVMMLHLQKMGGSLMCSLARNAERVVEGPNCNWNHVDFDPAINATRPTCAERVEHFTTHNFTYGQVERPFEKGDHCPNDFIYFTMMRDPVSAATSIINFHPIEGGHENLLQCVEAGRQYCGQDLKYPDTVHWFDNYMVRFVLGRDVAMLPPGAITDEHAQAAIRVLEQFDLVTTLEGIKRGTTQQSLNTLLGWNLAMEEDLDGKWNPSKHIHEFTSEQKKRLHSLLRHDYTLYRHFSLTT